MKARMKSILVYRLFLSLLMFVGLFGCLYSISLIVPVYYYRTPVQLNFDLPTILILVESLIIVAMTIYMDMKHNKKEDALLSLLEKQKADKYTFSCRMCVVTLFVIKWLSEVFHETIGKQVWYGLAGCVIPVLCYYYYKEVEVYARSEPNTEEEK